MNKSKKVILTTATAFALLTTGTLSMGESAVKPPILGQTPTAAGVDNGRMIAAIQELGAKMEALTKAGMKSINNLAFELDKSLATTVEVNTQQENIQNGVKQRINDDTEAAIKQTLQPMANAALTFTSPSQPEVQEAQAANKRQQQVMTQLTDGVAASDTVHSLVKGVEAGAFFTRTNVGKPAVLHDSAFNFSAFIGPDAYTPEKQIDAQRFIDYTVNKPWVSYSENINFAKLTAELNKYKSQPVALAEKIQEFRNNDAYKKYQLTVRSMTAVKSVSANTLYELKSERMPIYKETADTKLEALSRAIGIEPSLVAVKDPKDPSKTVNLYRYASPMQIANYVANHHLNNKEWYQEVASASAETLQRKNVILSAEILSKLHQLHLDNEKMLSLLAMSNSQANQMNEMMLKTQVSELNGAIDAFTGSSSSNNDDSSITNNSSQVDTSKIDTSKIDTSNIDTSKIDTSSFSK